GLDPEPVPAVEPLGETRAPGGDPFGGPRARDERVGRPPHRPGPAAGRHGARRGVRPLPEPVPEGVADHVPARLAGGRPAGGRDRDAVARDGRGCPVADEGRPGQAARGPRGRRVAAERGRRGRGAFAPEGSAPVRPVRRHDRAEEETGSAWPGRTAPRPPPPAGLDPISRGADAFVYPSVYEGFGLPVLEAMSRGIPVVASTTSALPEVTGDAALGVNPRSVREIAAAIASLVGDVALAERLAAAGRLQAARFSWDETARMTLEGYERVLDAARARFSSPG